MKLFNVTFSSAEWCGYEKSIKVIAPDDFNEDDVLNNMSLAEEADDWLVDAVYVDEDDITDEMTEDDVRGTVSIDVREWEDEMDTWELEEFTLKV